MNGLIFSKQADCIDLLSGNSAQSLFLFGRFVPFLALFGLLRKLGLHLFLTSLNLSFHLSGFLLYFLKLLCIFIGFFDVFWDFLAADLIAPLYDIDASRLNREDV